MVHYCRRLRSAALEDGNAITSDRVDIKLFMEKNRKPQQTSGTLIVLFLLLHRFQSVFLPMV